MAYQTYLTDKALYDQYVIDKAAYDTYMASYTPWHTYFSLLTDYNDYVQNQLKNAARNTVVKTASYTIGDAGFTEPKTVSGMELGGVTPVTGSAVFMPEIGGDGKLMFFARSNNFTAPELAASNAEYADYRDQSMGTSSDHKITGTPTGATTGYGDPTAEFRYEYQTSMNDVYGKNTKFNFAVKQDDNTYDLFEFTPEGWDTSGTRLDNITMTMVDDTNFYLAYTTNQTDIDVYTYTVNKNGSNVNVTAYADKTVRKLYLQKGTILYGRGRYKDDAGKAALLRSLVDITDQDGKSGFISGLTGIDGAYKGWRLFRLDPAGGL